jgi:hypothetical protein
VTAVLDDEDVWTGDLRVFLSAEDQATLRRNEVYRYEIDAVLQDADDVDTEHVVRVMMGELVLR